MEEQKIVDDGLISGYGLEVLLFLEHPIRSPSYKIMDQRSRLAINANVVWKLGDPMHGNDGAWAVIIFRLVYSWPKRCRAFVFSL